MNRILKGLVFIWLALIEIPLVIGSAIISNIYNIPYFPQLIIILHSISIIIIIIYMTPLRSNVRSKND